MSRINVTKIWTLIIVIIFTNSVFAAEKINITKELKAFIKVKEIVVERPSEKYDELYFSILQTSNKKKATELRVPEAPFYWQVKSLDKIKNIDLWQGSLVEDESIQLIVSLIEADAIPFNPHDHLGSINVVMTNNDGKLRVTWEIPTIATQPKITQPNVKIPSFILKGDEGHYKITFNVLQE